MSEVHPQVRKFFSKIGSTKSRKKAAASRANLEKARAAKSAPVEKLEEAYQATIRKENRISPSVAARDIAKCKYYTLRDYILRRKAEKAGWTNLGPDPLGNLVGLPPNARSPDQYEKVPKDL